VEIRAYGLALRSQEPRQVDAELPQEEQAAPPPLSRAGLGLVAEDEEAGDGSDTSI